MFHLIFNLKCQRNMVQAIATEEDYAIEYDETIACDVCREVGLIFAKLC